MKVLVLPSQNLPSGEGLISSGSFIALASGFLVPICDEDMEEMKQAGYSIQSMASFQINRRGQLHFQQVPVMA